MAEVVPLSNPGDYKRVHQRIKKLWNEGTTQILPHAQRRMKQRRLDINDVQNVIKYGQIIEHSKPMELWRYTLLGSSVDGKRVKCVAEIDGHLLIVTVI